MITFRPRFSRLVLFVLAALLSGAIISTQAGAAHAATPGETAAANWARARVGSTNYRYLCLKFVYDAYINAGMSRATLDAKSGYVATSNSYPLDQWNYWMNTRRPAGTLRVGADAAPPTGAIIYFSNRLGRESSHTTLSVGNGQQISPDTDKVNGPQSVTTNSYRTMLGWWLPDSTPGPSPITPIGALDVAQSDTPGTVRVAGWASDGNDPSSAIDVHVYLRGRAGDPNAIGNNLGAASGYRSDVGAHGYDKTLAAPAGTYIVCAYAINIGPASPNPELGCRTVTVAVPIAACPAPAGAGLQFVNTTALSSGAAPTIVLQANWTGSAGCTYRLQQQSGGIWSTLYSGIATSAQVTAVAGDEVSPLRVVAANSAGAESAATAFPTRTLDTTQDTAVSYPNGSGMRFSGAAYWDNTLTLMLAPGVSAETSILADQVAVVATTGPDYGAFDVYIDGTLRGRVDTYSPTEKNRQVVATYSLTRAPHTVRLVVSGTAGRPAVALDAIASMW